MIPGLISNEEIQLFNNAMTLSHQLKDVVITDDEQCQHVRELLVEVNALTKQIEGNRTKIKKPHLDAGKAIDKEAAKYTDTLDSIMVRLKTKLADYAMEVERKRRLAEMERLAKEELADREAIASGRTPRLVTDVNVPPPADVALRQHIEYVVVDELKIPREFLMPDMDKIKAARKAGIMVPGVEDHVVQQVIAR